MLLGECIVCIVDSDVVVYDVIENCLSLIYYHYYNGHEYFFITHISCSHFSSKQNHYYFSIIYIQKHSPSSSSTRGSRSMGIGTSTRPKQSMGSCPRCTSCSSNCGCLGSTTTTTTTSCSHSSLCGTSSRNPCLFYCSCSFVQSLFSSATISGSTILGSICRGATASTTTTSPLCISSTIRGNVWISHWRSSIE